MKLQVAQSEGSNIFTGYSEAHVDVNGIRYKTNVVVMPDRVIERWTAADFAASLGQGHAAPFLRFVYLLGLRQYNAQRDQVQFFGRDGMVQPGLATAAAAAA